MASSNVGSEGDKNSGQQPATGKVSDDMTPVLEETLGARENVACPTDISVLNDYIMTHLFGFLPLADLKTCPLVNRAWNHISNQAILKRNCVIKFSEYEKTEDIQKLVQLIRTSFQFPWTKFKVEAQYTPSAEEKHRQIGNFLRVISPFVTHIEIRDPRIVHQSLEYPNLRKLNLWYDHDYLPTGPSQNSLLRLVERASKLSDITIAGNLKAPLFMDLLEIPTCRKITRLSLSWRMEGEHLVRLSELGFKLKFLKLTFDLTEVTVTADSVKAFLQSQSTCLEELHFGHDEYIRDSSSSEEEEDDDDIDPPRLLGLECPRMEKLKILRVPYANLYSRISYKDMFPALKRLTFWSNDSYPFFNDNIEPVETVEHLWFRPRHPYWILEAARQFPKLRSIFLIVSQNNLLNTVGHAMPQLEEMELLVDYGRFNTNAVLTGFSAKEVDSLKGLPSNQLDVLERSKEPVPFLKNLKKFRISGIKRRGEESLLSDFGCRFALLKMEHLEVFEIKGYCCQISDQVMERMRKKFVVRLEN